MHILSIIIIRVRINNYDYIRLKLQHGPVKPIPEMQRPADNEKVHGNESPQVGDT